MLLFPVPLSPVLSVFLSMLRAWPASYYQSLIVFSAKHPVKHVHTSDISLILSSADAKQKVGQNFEPRLKQLTRTHAEGGSGRSTDSCGPSPPLCTSCLWAARADDWFERRLDALRLVSIIVRADVAAPPNHLALRDEARWKAGVTLTLSSQAQRTAVQKGSKADDNVTQELNEIHGRSLLLTQFQEF